MTDNPAAALEQPFAALQNRTASAGELKAAAEAARAAVRALDAERELAPEREAKILSEMTPPTITPGIPPSRGRSIAEKVAALVKLDDETSRRTLDRKIAVGVAEQLDRLARSAAKAEAERDEKRKPFAELTRRAQEYALRVADYPAIAARVPSLFRTDCVIAQLGGSAYSRTPSPNGSHVRNERTFNVPRTIATEGILKTTKLPGFWPPRWSDYSLLERQDYEFADDAAIVGPLRDLCQNHDERRIVVSENQVDAAVARAQALLVAELNTVRAALGKLLAHDASITASDRDARYPDASPIFDPMSFPENWRVGMMSRFITLPSLASPAMAAE
jgi:hypothetical protein